MVLNGIITPAKFLTDMKVLSCLQHTLFSLSPSCILTVPLSVNKTTTIFLKAVFVKVKDRTLLMGWKWSFSSIRIWSISPSLPLEVPQRTLPQAPLHFHPHFLLPGSLQSLQRDKKGVYQERDSKNWATNPLHYVSKKPTIIFLLGHKF